MTHHHHSGHSHPPAQIAPSMLRASALQRLIGGGIGIILLWSAVFWALV
jgi:hypothetical protein